MGTIRTKIANLISEAAEVNEIYNKMNENVVSVLDEYIQNNNQGINTWQDFQDSKSTFGTSENSTSLTDEYDTFVEDEIWWCDLFDVTEEEYDKYKYYKKAAVRIGEVEDLITKLKKLL